MSKIETKSRPRVVILENIPAAQGYSTSKPRSLKKTKKKKVSKHRSQTNNRKLEEQAIKSSPLEITPVINAILHYGRKTHSLGVLQASTILKNIASHLRERDDLDHELEELMHIAETHAKKISSDFRDAYEES